MMEEKSFVWTSKLTKKMFQLRFEHESLFKKKKQPWGEFHKILLDNGFPQEMTVKHVSKKWSYTFDMYKIAKKTNNKDWKYYKMFDKYFGKNKTLDKYDSWSDEWRLKLIICIIEAKDLNMDFQMMWRTVERAMRCQDLPGDCCIQDIKGLWHHIRMTFTRKHRLKIKKGIELTEWPLYDVMIDYYQRFEPEYLVNLETSICVFGNKQATLSKHCKSRKKDINRNDSENDFHWTKDITEAFIQSRLQNDWLFRRRKWPWNEFLSIMREEYGFPKTLTSRDICRKWAATFAEYQKAKATNNKSWVYYNLFELYLGEGSLSLNPLVDWQEEWVFNLISTRTSLDHMFKYSLKDQTGGWREVEKIIRSMGLPRDHSLLDLPEIWTHLIKTFKWKRKFANKGILNEQWPYYDTMSQYVGTQTKQPKTKQKQETEYFDDAMDDYEDNLKLFDLKQRLELPVKPKFEAEVATLCRSCSNEDGCVNIFEEPDEDSLGVADKLKIIGGVEVEKTDRLPSLICINCLQQLENAYKFRRKCQEIDKHLRSAAPKIKIEILDKQEDKEQTLNNNNTNDENNKYELNETETQFDADAVESDAKNETIKKEIAITRRKKTNRKLKYHYWKICEICGKHTRNLISHLDTHSMGKTYSCDVCEKKFKFKSGLLIHKAVHDPTPRKTCEVCGKTFHVLAQYRRHFVYHANERKFECETCGKRFNTVDILKVHNRTHTDERPFSCEECGKTFRTAGCVSRHKRIVHRNIKKFK